MHKIQFSVKSTEPEYKKGDLFRHKNNGAIHMLCFVKEFVLIDLHNGLYWTEPQKTPKEAVCPDGVWEFIGRDMEIIIQPKKN